MKVGAMSWKKFVNAKNNLFKTNKWKRFVDAKNNLFKTDKVFGKENIVR
ncbi:hypothetical protein Gotri_024709 [Gossypium trilobum]|uniref:Uncharacterized protein n=1 Tax=Gossypium trilobum TaxID=34281 RepID=A0A7J9DNA5_9ROSI|nr:hypothetical protein [Gossypium trilobum]